MSKLLIKNAFKYFLKTILLKPNKILRLIVEMLKITESSKASGIRERIIINLLKEKESNDFNLLTHVQRYLWVKKFVKQFKCLDMGCGSGYGTYYLARYAKKIIGIDISSDAIKFAKTHYKRKNLKFLKMNVCNLKFKNNYFDVIISFDVLEHLTGEEQEKMMVEITRVLKRNGWAILGTPNASVSLSINRFHKKELTRKEFEQMLKKFFKNVEIYCQDMVINGIRMKEKWHKCIFRKLSLENLIISKKDCDNAFGLIAICKK